MSGQSCDVREAVRRVDAAEDVVGKFPESESIARRALDFEDVMFDAGSGPVAEAKKKAAVAEALMMSVFFLGVLVPGLAVRFWADMPSYLVYPLVATFVLSLVLGTLVFPVIMAVASERFTGTRTLLVQHRNALAFRQVAAEALNGGCAVDAVQEAAFAADGDIDRFRAIVSQMVKGLPTAAG